MLSVVIPAYNEAFNIGRTVSELEERIQASSTGDDYEILIIDDHSSDDTYQSVEALGNPKVACIRLSRRSGSHTALRIGLRAARGNAILCLSADGQDDPKTLDEMIASWRNGTQVVWALRNSRGGESIQVRLFAVAFYRLLSSLTGIKSKEIDLSRADFYLLDRVVVDAINSCPELNTSLFGLIAWIGFRQGYVEYDRRERHSGSSKWNFRSRMRLAKDWIIAFSGLPLKLMTIAGALIASLGFLYAFIIIINSLLGHPVEGWSSLMVAVLTLSGIQIAMLGVMGEYLWRNLDESRKRPLAFVERSTNAAVGISRTEDALRSNKRSVIRAQNGG